MGYEMTLVPLGPVYTLQGRYVRRVTPRLPEAPGPRAGTLGTGLELRLLLLGDSAAAGVGAPSQDEALCGRLTSELAQSFRVSWALVARIGATTAGTTRHLLRSPAARFDVAVVSLGGNDVMGGRPLARWLEDVDELAAVLRTRFEVRHLLLSACRRCTPCPLSRNHCGGISAPERTGSTRRWQAGREAGLNASTSLSPSRASSNSPPTECTPGLWDTASGASCSRVAYARAGRRPPPRRCELSVPGSSEHATRASQAVERRG